VAGLRIVMLGTMGRVPFGGHVWVHLNWLRGLRLLGHDVWYVEDGPSWPFDPDQNTFTSDCTYAIRSIQEWLQAIGIVDRWAFRLTADTNTCWGLTEPQLKALYRSCDLLINMGGGTWLYDDQLAAPFRVLLQTDPVTAELRLANGDQLMRVAFDNHDLIVTCAENYGDGNCRVPLNGREAKYRNTRQAIDTDLWPMAFDQRAISFTTIGNWKQTGQDVEYLGEIYRWSKHYEWLKFIELPRKVAQPFEVALKMDCEHDRQRLESCGWNVVSSLPMSLDVFGSYPEFIRRSRGEWTVAKDQNIRFRTGWFSDRDATYLASGKPVIAQDTGFGDHVPTGRGLFQFSTMDDIVAAIEIINGDYRGHCEAAREIAVEYFGAAKIAEAFLHNIGKMS
jgi:hypothetical protein